jgi:hypothetical protein
LDHRHRLFNAPTVRHFAVTFSGSSMLAKVAYCGEGGGLKRVKLRLRIATLKRKTKPLAIIALKDLR